VVGPVVGAGVDLTDATGAGVGAVARELPPPLDRLAEPTVGALPGLADLPALAGPLGLLPLGDRGDDRAAPAPDAPVTAPGGAPAATAPRAAAGSVPPDVTARDGRVRSDDRPGPADPASPPLPTRVLGVLDVLGHRDQLPVLVAVLVFLLVAFGARSMRVERPRPARVPPGFGRLLARPG
jgi:hypothetical protein